MIPRSVAINRIRTFMNEKKAQECSNVSVNQDFKWSIENLESVRRGEINSKDMKKRCATIKEIKPKSKRNVNRRSFPGHLW